MSRRVRLTRPDGRRVWRYRLVMEQHLGRELGRDELVHHVNEDPLDDRLENLELTDRSAHASLHHRHQPRPTRRKLTDKQVRFIRHAARLPFTNQALATHFDVSSGMVSNIANYKRRVPAVRQVYVAGRTNNIPQVRRIQQLAREAGHRITYDWCVNVEEVGGAENEKGVDPGRQAVFADADRVGVKQADLLIAVLGPQVCGTLIEIGIALGGATEVWLLGTLERESVFFQLPGVRRFSSEDDLRSALHA